MHLGLRRYNFRPLPIPTPANREKPHSHAFGIATDLQEYMVLDGRVHVKNPTPMHLGLRRKL